MYRNLSLTFSIGIFFITSIHTVGADSLKPSLSREIIKNESLLKSNLAKEKINSNTNRLKEIRQGNAVKKTVAQFYQREKEVIGAKTTKNIPIQDFSQEKANIKTITPTLSSATILKGVNTIPNVDTQKVRDTWFGWYNEYRSDLGLGSYGYDPRLDITAHDWNVEFAKGKGMNHHTRNPGDGYYNFPVIDKWFIARGIDPKVIDRAKHTENVGYGYYNCRDADCTDELIASIRTTWNFFMSERGKSYDAHYRTIIQPHFTKMGYDIIVKPEEKRYYMTIHFITE